MLGWALLTFPVGFVVAAWMDVHDRRRGRARRDPGLMVVERRDLQADMTATQHQGIHTPIGQLCRDRHRAR